MDQFRLQLVSAGMCQVRASSGLHVGNLKLIAGVWKFKAVGYNLSGQLVPGGGPLTDLHNVVFAELDESEINRVLN